MKRVIIAVLAAACVVPAMAADMYAGASLGRSRQTMNVGNFSASSTGFNLGIFGGVQFNDHIGAEIGLDSLDEAGYDFGNGARASTEPTAGYAAVTATWRLGAAMQVYAKAGVANTLITETTTFNGATTRYEERHNNAMFGVGAGYALTPKTTLIAEYHNYGKIVDDAGVTVKAEKLAFGARYKF